MRKTAALLLAAWASGCASLAGLGSRSGMRDAPASAPASFALGAAPTQPAARGTVSVGLDPNGNGRLRVSVEHLADPSRLSPPRNVYVAWVQADDSSAPQNVGALQVDRDLKGTLDTVTPLHAFRFFITAEASPTAEEPTGRRELQTSVSR